jgi:hypothetical protein
MFLAIQTQPGPNNSLAPGSPGLPANQRLVQVSLSLPAAQGLNSNQVPSFAIPTGFPGRLIFPNTGVNVRSPTGDGPMQAPAGVFLPGGGDQSPPIAENPPVRRPPPPPLPLPGTISADVQDISGDVQNVDVDVSPVPEQQPEEP